MEEQLLTVFLAMARTVVLATPPAHNLHVVYQRYCNGLAMRVCVACACALLPLVLAVILGRPNNRPRPPRKDALLHQSAHKINGHLQDLENRSSGGEPCVSNCECARHRIVNLVLLMGSDMNTGQLSEVLDHYVPLVKAISTALLMPKKTIMGGSDLSHVPHSLSNTTLEEKYEACRQKQYHSSILIRCGAVRRIIGTLGAIKADLVALSADYGTASSGGAAAAAGKSRLFRSDSGGILGDCLYTVAGKDHEHVMVELAKRYHGLSKESQTAANESTVVTEMVAAINSLVGSGDEDRDSSVDIWMFQLNTKRRGKAHAPVSAMSNVTISKALWRSWIIGGKKRLSNESAVTDVLLRFFLLSNRSLSVSLVLALFLL
jgi:hypothetical protein